MRSVLKTVLLLGAASLLLVGIVGHLGDLVWWFDLFANFRLHYVMVGAATFLLSVALRTWLAAIVALVAIAVSAVAVLQVPIADPPSAAKEPVLIVGSFNVLFNNTVTDAAQRFAQSQQPDVIVFQEFSARFMPSLEKLRDRYPYQAVFALKKGGTDVVMVSRFPLIDAKLIDDPEQWMRVLKAEIEFEGVRLQIITLHPPTPTSASLAAIRDRNFVLVAELANASEIPSIVVGDFNATVWSKPLRQLFATTQLRAAAYWPDLTFPSTYFWPVRIPIDTVLISPGLSFIELQTAPRFGSDHSPIVARIAIGPRQ